MSTPQYTAADVAALGPVILLALGGIVLLLAEAFQTSGKRGYQAWLTAVVAALAAAASLPMIAGEAHPVLFTPGRSAFVVADRFGGFVSLVICAGLFLSALAGAGFLRERKAERGEYYALLLLSASGMVLLGQSTDLLMIFIGIEVMSVGSYALAAYMRRGKKPAEAAFKYFILGAMASAILLYGIALVYGATGGRTGLADIAAAIRNGGGTLLWAGIALVGAGFAFKVAAVPFHMWTPDVYEGAATPVTGFMAVTVKAAAFAALVRTFVLGFGDASATAAGGWGEAVAWIAFLTMFFGNLLAIPQRSVKRLIAYSSIAHAGYLLVGVAAAAVPGARVMAGQGVLYYLAAYTFTAVGAFAVVAALERRDGEATGAWDLDRFAGVAKTRPALAWAMALFMISLAGLPPTAGFVGKLYIFQAAIDAKLYLLAVAGILTSLMGVYYYLKVVVYLFMREEEPMVTPAPAMQPTLGIALGLAAAGTLLLGVWPGLIDGAVAAGAAFLGG
jgi:NADH-quinone oxidoreductase subunit N